MVLVFPSLKGRLETLQAQKRRKARPQRRWKMSWSGFDENLSRLCRMSITDRDLRSNEYLARSESTWVNRLALENVNIFLLFQCA